MEIQRDDAGNGASERDRSFAGKRFAKHLHAARRRAAIHDVDLRKRNVGKFLVVPEHCWRWNKKSNVKAVVPALAVQKRDELV